MRFVRPQMLGNEAFYDATDRDIAHLAGRLAALGVTPRTLMAWRLSAEREADVFEPIVRIAQSARGEDEQHDAMKLLDDLIALGEELRTALLRSVTKGIRDNSAG
jgi:hypothetical protein